MIKHLVYSSIVLTLFSLHCTKQPQVSNIIAKVGDTYLTADMLKMSIDTSMLRSEYQMREYVLHWVTSELLYQEAKRRGLANSPVVNRTLDELQKQLSINQLLENEIYDEQNLRISTDEVSDYYRTHSTDFTLSEEVIHISYAAFRDRGAANTYRSNVLKETSWQNVLHTHSSDSALTVAIVEVADSQYFKQRTLSPPELWKVVTTLSPGEISFPIKTSAGYFVVRLIDVQRPGQVAELPYVVQEIKDRIVIEKRQKILNLFLEQLKKKYNAQIYLPAVIPQDTTTLKHGD